MFKRAVAWKLVRENPVSSSDPPRVRTPEMKVLMRYQIRELLDVLPHLEFEERSRAKWWRLANAIVVTALGTAMRRGELLGLRWRDVDLDTGLIHVRETRVLGRTTTPKSASSRRTISIGETVSGTLEDLQRCMRYTAPDDFVFTHPERGTPIDPSRFTRAYLRPAMVRAGISMPFRPFHDLRHTAITYEAAAGNPHSYIQMKAGHSSGAITERYIHSAQVIFPGAAARAEAYIFGDDRLPR